MSLEKVITGIAASSLIQHVRLSPSATQVVYVLVPVYSSPTRPDGSSLWISSITAGSKARPLTPGAQNDSCPAWHPDEKTIYFLSDRDGVSGIYALHLDEDGKVEPLTSTTRKSAIQSFWLSPNGRHIAYTAARGPTPDEECMEREKDDAEVFGDPKSNAQLWLLELGHPQEKMMKVEERNDAVVNVAWSSDSQSLAVMTQALPGPEFSINPVSIVRLSISPHDANEAQVMCDLPRFCSPTLQWSHLDEIAVIQGYVPEHLAAANTLHLGSVGSERMTWKKLYGEKEDVLGVVDIGRGHGLAVAVAYGVQTRIDLVSPTASTKVLWKPNDEAPTNAFDVNRNAEGDYTLAVVRSSGIRCEPNELWIGTITAADFEDGATISLTQQLSYHNTWTDDIPKLMSKIVQYNAEDGTVLEGIVTWPKDKERYELPTVLFPHGGPYYRDTPSFNVEWYWEREVLAFAGYLVLSPQYRGSMGNGHNFAHAAQSQMGTTDWADCYSLLQYALAQGWADECRLGMAGWSQGGFLTAWGVSQTKDLFKAAVVGCGITDWASMVMEAEEPDLQADLAGFWPWSDQRLDQMRSPIVHVKGIKTPMLILHGKEDSCVPVAQGIGFHRGLRRASENAGMHQLVLYPREGHMFHEQKHAEDAMRRLGRHMNAYLT